MLARRLLLSGMDRAFHFDQFLALVDRPRGVRRDRSPSCLVLLERSSSSTAAAA